MIRDIIKYKESRSVKSKEIDDLIEFLELLDTKKRELSRLRSNSGQICYNCPSDFLTGKWKDRHDELQIEINNLAVEIESLYSK